MRDTQGLREMVLWFGLALLLSSPVYAGELDCTARFLQQAEFGARELGAPNNICPGIPSTEEQSCVVTENGIEYGVSVGWMVNKEIVSGSYSGNMPFGVKWGEKRDASEAKILRVTRGDPKFFKFGNVGFDLEMSSGYCFLTKGGHEYGLELYFDKDKGLSKIIGRILYP